MMKLEYLLAELESHQLTVVLVPLNPGKRNWNDGGCKRVCVDKNARWYQLLCQSNTSKRGTRRGRQDTIIRRAHTIRALNRLIAGKPRGGIYEERIMDLLPSIRV